MLEYQDYMNNLTVGGKRMKKAEGLGMHQYCIQCGKPHQGGSKNGEHKLCKECASTVSVKNKEESE